MLAGVGFPPVAHPKRRCCNGSAKRGDGESRKRSASPSCSRPTLPSWLLVATWIRINAETLYYGRSSLGSTARPGSATSFSLVFVPVYGLLGLAFAALAAAVLIFAWRAMAFTRRRGAA